MTLEGVASRAAFADHLAQAATLGERVLVLAPLGAGKTHTLLTVRERLRALPFPCAFLDLFTAASTPERLLETLAERVRPFTLSMADEIEALVAEGARDRLRAGAALLRFLSLLATRPADEPFVWLVDEVTEIRSLAYFPELGHIEEPFTAALMGAHGSILTSSYSGLAADLFKTLPVETLPGMTASDLAHVPSLRSDSAAVSRAIDITKGFAATLLPLVADMKDTRDLERSLIRLLRPGGGLELPCRRHYEVLLMRSRGYAVSKRAAEVVAAARGQRLTDLFPAIGRTPGASRQYLRWLVEVGMLSQVKKRYDFADPVLGLWASLYLNRGDSPTEREIEDAVGRQLAPSAGPDSDREGLKVEALPQKRIDRFEEID